MKINFFENLIGSGFYTGYIKKASGTFGSLAGLLIYLIPGFENPSVMIFFISLFIVIGVPIAIKFENKYGTDPKEYTNDEVIGMWISLLFVPKKIWWIIIAFLIWRFLDIVKPFPAKQLENVKNGWGVLLDDIAAGIYSFIILQLIIYVFNLIIN
ncbi:MAG: phosphatidylglycerophosphatase A [Stygiobacter sp.]|uniref:Phosphatidylglycerophosphatase A n=1 Tax=Stygiobacter electus TaxID=3032292 RepID=A0AAE3P195_9BACT|nr:phosphatidylglycerophosphatase A [Stygiobacter electus]MDF1612469.1 phosphatidylglycerophosphatase A [Stygiobacter electus]